MVLLRIISSAFFLTAIILSVPLVFDVGGRNAGLAFSLSLATFYFLVSSLYATTPDDAKVRKIIIIIVRGLQWFIVATLMIWVLGRFSIDAPGDSSWAAKTFGSREGYVAGGSIFSKIFGLGGFIERGAIGSWDKLLRWSAPVFQLAEGFCTLLVIQAVGQLGRWLVNRSERSDTWMLFLITMSASVGSTSLYFLWRVLKFPDIDSLDSTLIGVIIASAIFLCIWGITSGRGTAVESSLLFAYVVLCIYQIFTDYKPSPETAQAQVDQQQRAPDFPPFPPIIMSSYSSLLEALNVLPVTFVTSFNFVAAAFNAVTPSVIISLGYRIFVLYSATRIIPAVEESGARGLSLEPTLEDSTSANRFLTIVSYFSPSILIAVYTSLLMQHFATTIGGYTPGITGTIGAWLSGTAPNPALDGNVWKWVNVVGTMALYAIELYIGREDGLEGSHWKVD